jgi:RPA family protein
MSDDTTVAPAGDSAPVTATPLQPMTAAAASALLASYPDDDDAPAPPEPAPSEPVEDADTPEPEPEGEGGEEAAVVETEQDAPEEGETPDEEAQPENQPEPEGYDWDKVPGEAKFRLRDGTVVTAADVKKRWDALSTAEQEAARVAADRQQFEQARAQAAQQYQQFLPVAQQAIQAIQNSLPQVPNPPDPSLATTDPIRYVEERARYDATVNEYNTKVGQMRQIAAQAQDQQKRAQAEQRQQLDGYIREQQKALLDAMPDLRDTAKRETFYRDFVDVGTRHYGFSQDELNAVHDARLMRMAADP